MFKFIDKNKKNKQYIQQKQQEQQEQQKQQEKQDLPGLAGKENAELPVLSVRNLNLYFTQYERGLRRRELHPLRDLSCDLKAGELAAVVGASGSGKSLLAHAILGILPYNCRMEGEIRYQGEALGEEKLRLLRGHGISLIPQGVSYLDPLMKIGDQICAGKRDIGTRNQCRQLLKRYGLNESVEMCYPFELSGGMARRVLMAAALMEHPDLIVADEPTPGLEAATAWHIIHHLKEMAQEGAAVLLITHDLELALKEADRIFVFYDGTILEEVDPADFRAGRNLKEAYTQAMYRALQGEEFSGNGNVGEL